MTSEESEFNKGHSEFKQAFDHALQKAGITLTELASRGKFSRQNIAELKRENSNPSMGLMRKLWTTLRAHYNVEARDLVGLLIAAMGSEFIDEETRTIVKQQPYTFTKHELQKQTLKNRCIITDILAERIYDVALKNTLSRMKQDTDYFYFVPTSNTDRQTVLAKVPRQDLELFDAHAYFIRSPAYLFFVRIRIDNLGQPGQNAFYSIPPEDDLHGHPTLRPLHPSITSGVENVIAPIIAQAPEIRNSEKRNFSISTSDGELRFELDY